MWKKSIAICYNVTTTKKMLGFLKVCMKNITWIRCYHTESKCFRLINAEVSCSHIDCSYATPLLLYQNGLWIYIFSYGIHVWFLIEYVEFINYLYSDFRVGRIKALVATDVAARGLG